MGKKKWMAHHVSADKNRTVGKETIEVLVTDTVRN